jgi:hypothetical protein
MKPKKEIVGETKIAALFDAEATMREAAIEYASAENASLSVWATPETGRNSRNVYRRKLRRAAIAYARIAAELEPES